MRYSCITLQHDKLTSSLLELAFQFPASHQQPGGNQTLQRTANASINVLKTRSSPKNENQLIITTVIMSDGGGQATLKLQK